MSEPIRVALVAEGPTDRIVIESALRAMLANRPFILVQLQPEGSIAFGNFGGGWGGVYRWCKQSSRRGSGRLSSDRLLQFDLLIVHVDADVAAANYGDANVTPDTDDLGLPCELPCPPASDTTNALRHVVCSWMGETSIPERVILCVPSKNTEAWVVAMLFPTDPAIVAELDFECLENPSARLGQQSGRNRLRKAQRDYLDRAGRFELEWPRVSADAGLSEARRFYVDVGAFVGTHLL